MTETNKPSESPPNIEFWFEFGSNYSYLSVMRIEDAARRHGIRVVWKPFLLGPIFRALGMENSPFVLQKAKGAYVWRDMERQCRKHGLQWRRPTAFPRLGVLPARIELLGADEPWIDAFCRAVMHRNFVCDLDISGRDGMTEILAELGLAVDLLALAQSDAVKAGLREQTEQARRRSIFGAPTFFVGSEMFWGNDRLDDALVFAAESAAARFVARP